MKFGELKLGTVFRVDGETYVKTSPMIGSNKASGAQKFMRRSVEVELSDQNKETKVPAKTHLLSRSEVVNAFADFYANCEQCLQTLSSEFGEKSVGSVRSQLEQARKQFMEKIT